MSAIGWQVWALLSAVFAALTAIMGKVGVEGRRSRRRDLYPYSCDSGSAWRPTALDRAKDWYDSSAKLRIFDLVRTSNRCLLALLFPRP